MAYIIPNEYGSWTDLDLENLQKAIEECTEIVKALKEGTQIVWVGDYCDLTHVCTYDKTKT